MVVVVVAAAVIVPVVMIPAAAAAVPMVAAVGGRGLGGRVHWRGDVRGRRRPLRMNTGTHARGVAAGAVVTIMLQERERERRYNKVWKQFQGVC